MIHRKSLLCLPVCLFLLGSTVLTASEKWAGWVTDQPCAKAGHFIGAEHKKHAGEGQPVVFVNESDKSIHMISNPDKVKNLVGEKVTLTGAAREDGTIEVESAASTQTTSP